MKTARLLFFYSLFLVKSSFAVNPEANYLFIKNQGQWPKEVFFKANISSGHLWITQKGIVYQLYDSKNFKHFMHKDELKNARSIPTKTEILTYGFKNQIELGNLKVSTPIDQKFNFFIGENPNSWQTNVAAYTEVYITEVFNNVDFRIYNAGQSLKYEYIVKPNGKPEDIKIKYEGVKEASLVDNELVLTHELGVIKEFEPFTYQLKDNKKVKINSNFKLLNKDISFEIDTYDKSKNLIIDPELVFSSYTGSLDDNWSHTATYDEKGNLYAGGTAFGIRYPVTSNVFQPKNATEYFPNQRKDKTDIVITKYSADGNKILYSTFLGGEDSEIPHSLIVNSKGELIVFGTTSSLGYPTTPNAFDRTFNGGLPLFGAPITTGIELDNGTDIFVSILGENGSKLVGSTFVGGSGNDGIHDYRALEIQNYGDEFRGEVYVDKNDKIYVASVTGSLNFPTVNAARTRKSNIDAIIFTLNQDCSNLLFSSYLGGSDYDAAYGIRVDEKSNAIYVCGTTRSKDIGTTSQAFKKNLSGKTDAFIVKIVNNIIVANTYLGTNEEEIGILIDLDDEGNVYMFGLTSGDYPTTAGVYKNPKSGQFIHALDANLNLTKYATTFGSGRKSGNVDIVPTAFLVNKCGNVYVAGWGGKVNTNNGFNASSSTNGLPITPNALQKTTTGSNYYFAIFEKGLKSLLYGTYFGSSAPPNKSEERGDHLDGGTCRFDKNGIIYHTACVCKAGGFVEFPIKNAAQPNNNNSNCNMAAFKLSLDALTADYDLFDNSIKNPEVLCAPVKIDFKNNSVGAETYEWTLNDVLISRAKEINYTFQDSGSYQIKLKAFNKILCTSSDSTLRLLKIKSFKNSVSNDSTVCSGGKVLLKATGGLSYKWSPENLFKNTSIPTQELVVTNSQVFSVEIKSEECSIKKEIKITVSDTKADFGTTNNTTICKGQNVTLTTSGSANRFVWTSTNMVDSTQKSINVNPTETTIYNVTGFYEDGCKPKKEITVSIDNSVKMDFGFDYTIDCNEPSAVVFTNKSVGGVKYVWELQGGVPIETQVLNKLVVKENKETSLTLKSYSSNGCEFVLKKDIKLNYYDGIIPNVITPNNDKKNDTFVIGLPESKLEIFNSWGKKIFNEVKYQNNWGKNIDSGSYYYTITIPNGKICKGWLEVIN